MQKKDEIVEVAGIDELHKYHFDSVSAAIGVFDGVHKGHQHLLNVLKTDASSFAARPVAITFFPHPKALTRPTQSPQLLISHKRKISLLHETGLAAVVTIPFTESFSLLSPEQFLESFLSPELVKLKSICVGSKWRFGHGGKGDVETLAKFAKTAGFFLRAVPEYAINGTEVSSTAIRQAVSGGDLLFAEKMLGHQHSIVGIVERGLMLASNVLGFPTANIKVTDGIIPPEGVYSGVAVLDGKKYPAAISIGTAPSLKKEKERKILTEAHILNFYGDIYGKELEIHFGKYLREQRYYGNPEELKAQIAKDIKLVEKYGKIHCN